MTKLSLLIQEIRRKRRLLDPGQLTDVELLMELAALLSNDPLERKLIVCALAVPMRYGPDREENLKLLQDVGVSAFTSEQLVMIREHDAFRDLWAMLHTWPDNPDDPKLAEVFGRIRDLAIRAGSTVAHSAAHGGANEA